MLWSCLKEKRNFPGNNMRKAKVPFSFYSHVELRESTGLKARNLRELVNIIKDAPGSVIYYHTHVFLQQHQFASPEPPNAFAYWVTHTIGDEVLGEKLGSIDISQYYTIRALREKIIEVIEGHLFDIQEIRSAVPGKEFDFTKSRSFVFTIPYRANDLAEFVEALKKITLYSLHFHIFAARLKFEKAVNDFSNWITLDLNFPELAEKIDKLDPYTYTLVGLRDKIIEMIKNSPEWNMD